MTRIHDKLDEIEKYVNELELVIPSSLEEYIETSKMHFSQPVRF